MGNPVWVIGLHGYQFTGQAPQIELDPAKFSVTLAPSGTVLGKVTATGKYGKYDPAANDGRQTAAGFLLNSANLSEDTSGNLFLAGFVQPAYLPVGHGLDAAARTALRHCVFLDV
ncbi:head decoration protein [Nocardia sp. NPDC058705]|uniref:head decoration protein n=1 Tax=Nocardia sp. NPDC058705 TaxID=3346609 RepID=UPI0036A4497F